MVQLLVEILQSGLPLLLDVIHGLHVPVLGLGRGERPFKSTTVINRGCVSSESDIFICTTCGGRALKLDATCLSYSLLLLGSLMTFLILKESRFGGRFFRLGGLILFLVGHDLFLGADVVSRSLLVALALLLLAHIVILDLLVETID